MTIRNIIITSKNRITIPADILKEMQLNGDRLLSIRSRGNEVILKPEPALKVQLQKIWEQLPPFRGTLSEEDLKYTTQEPIANKKY
jgi:AbrB family looped-hinge helix DNA binding protein